MDEKKQSPAHSDKCFFHLLGLKFILAGDLESTEPLDTLLQRWKTIEWDDPEFLKLSQEMRNGLSDLTPEQDAALFTSIAAILHANAEADAELNEARQMSFADLKTIMEERKKLMDLIGRYQKFSVSIIEVCRQMRDRLEILNDDVSVFEIPDI